MNAEHATEPDAPNGAGHGSRAIISALLANLGIAVAKFVGFLITGSSSMLSESIHSVADTGNQGLLILGRKRATRDADTEHPFGYGRERFFWAFVVALVLFSLGSLFSIFEGIQKIRDPHELESTGVAIAILGIAMCLEGFSFRTAVLESRPLKASASWSTFIRRAKNPELPVVLLEDAGALIGLVIALVAILTATATDNALWDGVGTLLIGLLLGAIAIVLAVEMKSLLIGESASVHQQQAIVDAVASTPSVGRLIHLRTQHLGPEELLVAAKVEFDGHLSVAELATAVDELEVRVRQAVPIARVIYIEPDVFRAPDTVLDSASDRIDPA